ncbi:MAG TPA: hypothetical protein EYP49_03155 [Anaerolineae bacterium]|nr:hypothetical protein [Anaerolineae bacterium]
MGTILAHFGHHRRDFRHLVTIWLRVLAHQLVPTAAAHVRLDVVHLFDSFYRHQFPGHALVSRLCTPFPPALGPPVRLSGDIRSIAEWWPRGVARVAIEPLAQDGYLCLQRLHVGDQ